MDSEIEKKSADLEERKKVEIFEENKKDNHK